MTPDSASVRRYQGSLGARISGLVIGVVASVVVAFMITKFGLANLANVRNDTVLVIVFFALIAVGVTLSVRSLVNSVAIVVQPSTVEVFKGRVKQHTLPRSQYRFGSFVVRQATSQRVTERRLIATSASERLEIACSGFSKASFDDLVAELEPLSAGSDPAATPAASPRGGVYTLEPRSRIPGLAVSLGIVVVIAFACTFGIASLMVAEPITDSDSLVSALIMVGILIIVLGVPIALLIVRLVRVQSIPSRIELSGAGLVVDGRVFSAGQLTRVSLTPESYRGTNKRLTLVEGNGIRTRYLLETGGLLARKPVFAQYAQFCVELARCLPTGVVRYELS